LKKESKNPQASAAYRNLLDRIVQEIDASQRQLQLKTHEATEYNRKIIQVYESYKCLERGYREEHKGRLDLLDAEALASLKAQEQQEALQKANQEISELKASMQKQNEVSADKAKKQGIGRKNIEEKLMHAEVELEELRKKIQDRDGKLAQTVSEADLLRRENGQIKLLLTYFQQPAIQQQQQQQQQQQPQQQQQQQPQQNPQHRNYNYTM
jgi:regulator of replication initiation timing